MGTTQQARDAYREHLGGFYTSGSKRGKPYLRNGWQWPLVRYPAGLPISRPWVDLPVHPAAVAWHQALAAVMLHHNYLFRETAGGTVNLRNIATASSERIELQIARQYPYATSLHAHGLPIDINPSKNPIGSSRPDELDEARWARFVLDAKNIRTVEGVATTKWGGDWSIDDDMHWEPTRCTRQQLTRGIDTASFPGWAAYQTWANNPTTNPPPTEEEGMSIKNGDTSTKGCAELQKAMRLFFGQDNGAWAPWPGTSKYDGLPFQAGEDGDPGDTFEANVRNCQQILGIPETGVADGFTTAFILAEYGTTGGGMSPAQVDEKIAVHAKQPDGHQHKHPEGKTGAPIAP